MHKHIDQTVSGTYCHLSINLRDSRCVRTVRAGLLVPLNGCLDAAMPNITIYEA